MKRQMGFCLWLVMGGVLGCASPKVMTHVTSEPAGARIEVNGVYVGRAPVDVALPQSANNHKLKGRVLILAMPGGPGQKFQQKLLRGHQVVPGEVYFDMSLEMPTEPVEESLPSADTNSPPAAGQP